MITNYENKLLFTELQQSQQQSQPLLHKSCMHSPLHGQWQFEQEPSQISQQQQQSSRISFVKNMLSVLLLI